MEKEKFNDFVRKIRFEKEITLRQFCRESCINPSTWSKIERGLVSAPQTTEILYRIKEVLKLDDNDFKRLVELSIESQDISNLNEEDVISKLPVFVKTSSNQKLTPEQLKSLLEIMINDQKLM